MNTSLFKILFFTTLILVFPPLSLAEDIGGGYTCTDSKILKNNKEVKLSKAKNAIQDKIDAIKGNTQKAKSKRAALKTIKSNLVSCSKGTFDGGGDDGGGGTELSGTVNDVEQSTVRGVYVGGYTVGGVKKYLTVGLESVGYIKISIIVMADGLFVAEDKEVYCRFDFGTPLPATTTAVIPNPDYNKVAKLGTVTCTVKKFTGKLHDEFQVEIKNDSILSENRVNPDIAKFNFTMKSTQERLYDAIKLEGTFTASNDAGQEVTSGPVLVTGTH
jgi:hypothetical protein